VFKLTVAELADTGLAGSAAIGRAIEMISADRQQRYLKVNDTFGDAEQGSPAE
jgi:hypothetical protein